MSMDHPRNVAADPAESDYLAYAQAGDAAALERALRACADRAYTQARRRLGNASDAEDAVQEAFLQLARDGRRYDGTVPFAAWVGRLVHIACLRVQRGERRRRRREEVAMSVHRPHQADDDGPDEEAVQAAMDRLGIADRQAIDLHYFAGLSQADVAAAVGCSENAVALRLSRARERLRRLLTARGTAPGIAGVASLLAAQPAYAAPPALLAAAHSLVGAIASGAALPTTTISLSLFQKGLLLMSTHPVAAVACAGLLALAVLLPVALWSGEAKPVLPVVAPQAEQAVPLAVGEQPWHGSARQLLPYIAPDARFALAADWDFLRAAAGTTKPTSLLSDPRAAAAIAHIRTQFRLWAETEGDLPDLAKMLGDAHGVVVGIKKSAAPAADGSEPLPQPEMESMLAADLGPSVGDIWRRLERVLKESRSGTAPESLAIGPFRGLRTASGNAHGRDGNRLAIASTEAELRQAAARTGLPPAPEWLASPLALRLDFSSTLAWLAALDADGSDPVGLAAWFGPDWHNAKPTLAVSMRAEDGIWRSDLIATGIARLPLRPASPAIAGSVPEAALATLVLGLDLPRSGPALLAGVDAILGRRQREELLTQIAGLGLGEALLREALTGDVAVAVEAQAPLPAVHVVLGIRAAAHQRIVAAIDRLAARLEFSEQPAPAGASKAWSGVLPFGLCEVLLADDRLVISSGKASRCLLSRTVPAPGELVLDVDLPAWAALYLPLLYAQVPAKPDFFSDTPLLHLLRELRWNARGIIGDDPAKPPADLDRIMLLEDEQRLREHWRRLSGAGNVPLNPHVAIFMPSDERNRLDNGRVVYRCADGWRIAGERNDSASHDPLNPQELERKLAGLVRRAGTAPDQLKLMPIGEQPSFDRRWLPPPAVVGEHLPHWRVAVHASEHELRLSEDGLPGTMVLAMITSLVTERYGTTWHYRAVFDRDGDGIRQRHRAVLEALRRLDKALEARTPKDRPFLRPSEALAFAKVPLETFAPLLAGKPPSAANIDSLGFWHPSGWPHQHCQWLIPLGEGWFIEKAWYVTVTRGVDVANQPRVAQRAATAEEVKEVLQKWQEWSHGQEQRPAPVLPPVPDQVNDF